MLLLPRSMIHEQLSSARQLKRTCTNILDDSIDLSTWLWSVRCASLAGHAWVKVIIVTCKHGNLGLHDAHIIGDPCMPMIMPMPGA